MSRNTAPSLPFRTLMFRVLAIIIGIIMLIFGFQEWSRISHLREAGIVAVVDPIENYTERSRRGSKTYSADFTFTTEKGQKIQHRQTFPGELLADFENGIPVSVRYDPDRPSEFIFEKDEASMMLFLMGIGFIVGAFLLIRAPTE